jgi:hypothetical protein
LPATCLQPSMQTRLATQCIAAQLTSPPPHPHAQRAKCLLHAHPMLPCPVITMAAVVQDVRPRQPLPAAVPAALLDPPHCVSRALAELRRTAGPALLPKSCSRDRKQTPHSTFNCWQSGSSGARLQMPQPLQMPWLLGAWLDGEAAVAALIESPAGQGRLHRVSAAVRA